MRKDVLVARTKPDSKGRYLEMYMTGFRDGPAYGFQYMYDPTNPKKNRKKTRLKNPLYHYLLSFDAWELASSMNEMPSLWNPDDANPMGEYIRQDLEKRFGRV